MTNYWTNSKGKGYQGELKLGKESRFRSFIKKYEIPLVAGGALVAGLLAIKYLPNSCSVVSVSDAIKVQTAISQRIEQADRNGQILTPRQAYNQLNLEGILKN